MMISEMRKVLLNNTKYQGQAWKDKVKKMSDNQVIAVYLDLKRRKMFLR